MIKYVGLAVISFCLLFLFTFKITDVPPGINGDEASIGYNAISISQSLRDENGRLLPIFFLTMGGKDWKQPVTIYSTALLFKIFGPSYALLRLVSILFFLSTAVILYIFLKDVFDDKLALGGLVIFTATPILLIQSHLALENIAMLPFVVFWLYAIYKFEKTEKSKFLILAGISLGLSFYSYNGMRLVAPILLFLSLGYILFLNGFSLQKSCSKFKFVVYGLIPFILLIPIAQIKYPGALFGNREADQITSYQQFVLPYLSSFDLSFLFMHGDITPYHSTGKHGMFLLTTLPLFFLGVYQILQRKTPILILAVLAFVLSPLLYGFVGSVHRGSRLLVLIPFYSIISLAGVQLILQFKKNILKTAFISFAILLFVVNYVDFLKTYWFEYPNTVKDSFSGPIHSSFKVLVEQSKELKVEPLVEKGIYGQNIEASKFFEKVYFSKGLKFWSIGDDVPKGSIIFVRIADAMNLEQKGFKRINTGTEQYGLIINQ